MLAFCLNKESTFFHSFHYRIKSMAFSLFVFFFLVFCASDGSHGSSCTRQHKSVHMSKQGGKRYNVGVRNEFSLRCSNWSVGRLVATWIGSVRPEIELATMNAQRCCKTARQARAVNWLLFNHVSLLTWIYSTDWLWWLIRFFPAFVLWRYLLSGWPPSHVPSWTTRFSLDLSVHGNYKTFSMGFLGEESDYSAYMA